jgi:ATP-dependent Clp protease protease subunit
MKLRKDDSDTPQFDPYADFEIGTYKALLKDRVILLNSDIDKSVIERVVLPLTMMSQKNSKPIKLLINSPGGSVEDGQMVVDAILTSKAPVITVAMGKAMSAAFDIFLAGSYRIVYPNTVLMCHAGSTSMGSLTLPQINQEAELHKLYFLRWAKFYSSRTKISEKEWFDLLSTGLNRYFFPEESLAKGLCQEILPIVNKPLKNLAKFKI